MRMSDTQEDENLNQMEQVPSSLEEVKKRERESKLAGNDELEKIKL